MSTATHDTPHLAERRTRAVALLTAATMVAEIAAGWWFNSMALLADGWHMGTHAVAIGLSAWAYGWARRCHSDPAYAFGGWKVEMLAAFASAVALLATAVGIAAASVERLVAPQPIRYGEAMAVAVLGLVVNLACAWLLGAHHHAHDDEPLGPHRHDRHSGHHHAEPAGAPASLPAGAGASAPAAAPASDPDLNLRSAYLHVVADAATSALAIVALAGGLWLGWAWLDAVIGLVGALMVARWGIGLVRDSSRVLLDREMDHPFVADLRHALDERAPWGTRTHVTALRAWRVGRTQWAVALHLATDDPALNVARVRGWLQRRFPRVVFVTVQIEPAQATGAAPAPAG
jgi:cation diffusion facilitator family transporter